MGTSKVRLHDFLQVDNAVDRHANAAINRMILTGLGGIVIVEIYAAVMQREFQNTDNQVGKGFAILGIYLFVVTYCEFLSILSHLVRDDEF